MTKKTPDVAAKGQDWRRMGYTHRVLGVVEGYVVHRVKGRAAYCTYWKDFERNWVLVEGKK